MNRFRDRVVLITGGNSGIGRAASLAFAAEGGEVVIAARDEDKSQAVVEEVVAAGGVASSVVCDVTSASDAEAAVAAALDRHGRLDVVFNNAGVIHRDKTVPATTEAQWDDTFAVNVKGTFLISKAAVPVMAEQGGGAIVNNASYFGLVGGTGAAAYSASKGAVVLLTKSMALDHAADGIRVNCVCAGSVDTPMLAGEMEAMGGTDTVRPLFEAKHPIGRIATPGEIAAAVLFLASDESAFVTGAAFPIDGGLTAG